MRSERYLRRSRDFAAVYHHGGSWACGEVVMRALPNGLRLTRYGFVVGQRVGGAVVRNRVKRRLREIVRGLPLVEGWDIIFVARPPAAQADYHGLKQAVEDLLRKAGLFRRNEENCIGAH